MLLVVPLCVLSDYYYYFSPLRFHIIRLRFQWNRSTISEQKPEPTLIFTVEKARL